MKPLPWPRLLGRRIGAAGFTMVELLVVMAILGILAAAVMPLGETLLKAQRERELRQSLWDIRNAIDEYQRAMSAGGAPLPIGVSGYPSSLQVLVQGVPDPRAQAGSQTLYFLRRLPRDPMADPALPAEQTWRLRSYASPPDQPRPGADVYDVSSSSDALSLDGTPYSKW
ncbi:type II secretion system protein [Rhodoferax sp.]|uniref:type II secretion system protein n=1 Tax=Rhodoferax sp. TaxID=50421 RepID=UPI002776A856|nr:type II secretion system protein [Rhodoferax sp.]